jgi:hypothetical protein
MRQRLALSLGGWITFNCGAVPGCYNLSNRRYPWKLVDTWRQPNKTWKPYSIRSR